MSSLRYFLLCAALLALGACSRVHVGGDDAGPGTSDAGARERCGPVTCSEGQVCCNASCGVCTPPGLGCTTIACLRDCLSNTDCGADEYCAVDAACPGPGVSGTCIPRPEACDLLLDPVCGCDGATYGNACGAAMNGVNVASSGECGGGDCAPDDAAGEGLCDAIVGLAWNGTGCVDLSGCSCVGADCGKYMSRDQCLAEHATCLGGCSTDADCPSGEWCWFSETGQCATGVGGECTAGAPPGWSCGMDEQVCGCDGVTYDCAAMALSTGNSVLHEGPCDGPCAPQDARGVGPCAAILGVAWDGASCVTLGGCSCEGTDCGDLYGSMAECEAARAGCGRAPGGTCGGFAGETCRPDEYCDFADGTFCGGADESGTCRPRPEGCFTPVAPVCGCDGLEYSNACEANRAGTDVQQEGGCIVPG